VLGHEVIWGAFTDPAAWSELDELLRTRWLHPLGRALGVDAAVIDAGDGDHYDTVLAFCAARRSRRVFAGKGVFGARPGFQMAKGKTIANRLALIGIDGIKNALFDKLQRGVGIRFSHALEPIYYEQLAAERRVVRYQRGMPVRRFERTGRTRAEALDALVYATAARQSFQLTFDRREAELRSPDGRIPVGSHPPVEPRSDARMSADEYYTAEAERMIARQYPDGPPEHTWLDPQGKRRGGSFWDRE
jgi:phage terminase large subunit GpA-like protein